MNNGTTMRRLTMLLAMVTMVAAALATAACGKSGGEALVPAPKFGQTTTEPVLLRYKYTAGTTQKMEMRSAMDMRVDAAGQGIDMLMGFGMEMSLATRSVDAAGVGDCALTFTRMLVTVSAPQKMEVDTAKEGKDANPALAPFKAMIGVPLPTRVDGRGQVLSADGSALLKALGPAAAKAANAQGSFDQALKSSFTLLPEKPVKAGETFESGEMTFEIPGMGTLVFKLAFKVLAVSADRSRVLLAPAGEGTLRAAKEAQLQAVLKTCRLSGWMLFDVARGLVGSSALAIKMDMTAGQGASVANVKMGVTMTMTNR